MTVALTVKHNFVHPLTDDADPNTVSPSHWNEDHIITGVGQIDTELAAKADKATTLTAGAGLTGGGDLSANRTLAIGAGVGIVVNADDVALDTTHVRNVDHSAVSITAGAGLTGGGDISASRTLAVGAGVGITVNADDVAVDTAANFTWSGLHVLSNSTQSTSHTTGALRLSAGGLGVAGNVYVGGTLTALGMIGYSGGAGGQVTQLTSKATAVTLNKLCGLITMHNAALAADTLVSFQFNNSLIGGAADMMIVNHADGYSGKYWVGAYLWTTGACTIYVRNLTAGSLSEAIALQFFLLRAQQS